MPRVMQKVRRILFPFPSFTLPVANAKIKISAEGPASSLPHALQHSVTQESLGVPNALRKWGDSHPSLQRQLGNSSDAFTQAA